MNIYLLTLPNGSFGSSGQSWTTLDLDRIISKLDFKVIIKTIIEIDKLCINESDIIIYTSSENPEIRSYLKDNLFHLSNKAYLIPSYKLLMAHENKGYQEILKKQEEFGNLFGNYLFDLDNQTLPYPKVLKTSEGAGSSGVFLIKNEKELSEIKRKHFSTSSIKRKIINIQRKISLNSREFELYKYRKSIFKLLIEQKFIPNLKHDFKVLVFGDRYFVLKRSVRKNDFRASGSGNFEFVEPPREVLDFAKEISEKLDNPYLSLDIAQSKHGCHLIEFQATNFGPYTLLNAPYRYIDKDGHWLKEQNCKDLEANYAYALNHYISSILNNKHDF